MASNFLTPLVSKLVSQYAPVSPTDQVASFSNQGIMPGGSRPPGIVPLAPVSSATDTGRQQAALDRLSAIQGQSKNANLLAASARNRNLENQRSAQAVGSQLGAPVGGLSRYGSGYLQTNAARALSNLNAAFHNATGGNITLTEGYRDNARQKQLYDLYKAGKGNLAAAPGKSVHQTGRAADLGGIGNTGDSRFQWLVNNAAKYGWRWTGKNFSQQESWHWEYVGV